MRDYWLRIAIRAGLIFGVGMVALVGLRYVKREVVREARGAHDAHIAAQQAVQASSNALGALAQLASVGASLSAAHAARAATPVVDIPFRVDGATLGRLEHFRMQRRAAHESATLEWTVRLRDGVSPPAAACDLVATGELDAETGFRCAARGERALPAIGTARFEPGGATRVVRAEPRRAAKLVDDEPVTIDASFADGPADVRIVGADGQLAIQAGEHGARIVGRDGRDRSRFLLDADSTGAIMRVTDEQGKVVFSLNAGEAGVSITVDSTAR